MKRAFAITGLLACSLAHADLETSSQKLSACVIGYAEGQINTPAPAQGIAVDAFKKCSTELNELHDAIGPDKTQWNSLSDRQKQSVSKIRDQTTSKIREQMSSNVVSFIEESRKSV